MKRPAYLLLDEPFSELDDASKRRLLDFLSAFCTDDRTVLVVTHHIHRFKHIVDRQTVFDGRRSATTAPPVRTSPSATGIDRRSSGTELRGFVFE